MINESHSNKCLEDNIIKSFLKNTLFDAICSLSIIMMITTLKVAEIMREPQDCWFCIADLMWIERSISSISLEEYCMLNKWLYLDIFELIPALFWARYIWHYSFVIGIPLKETPPWDNDMIVVVTILLKNNSNSHAHLMLNLQISLSSNCNTNTQNME